MKRFLGAVVVTAYAGFMFAAAIYLFSRFFQVPPLLYNLFTYGAFAASVFIGCLCCSACYPRRAYVAERFGAVVLIFAAFCSMLQGFEKINWLNTAVYVLIIVSSVNLSFVLTKKYGKSSHHQSSRIRTGMQKFNLDK